MNTNVSPLQTSYFSSGQCAGKGKKIESFSEKIIRKDKYKIRIELIIKTIQQ